MFLSHGLIKYLIAKYISADRLEFEFFFSAHYKVFNDIDNQVCSYIMYLDHIRLVNNSYPA